MNAISPAQCRAARALLNWSREQLAEMSGVPVRTLADFETGATTPRAATLQKLSEAFGREGIALISVNGSPAGVTLIR
jgi:transcriptional regulator with XRE-family HTH domain